MKSHHDTVTDISTGVKNFFGRAFSSIVVVGPPLDPPAIQKNPLMVVCTHRSHTDYFLAGSLLFERGFKHMRFAAGDNLTKLPYIGPRFKALGAFTVARDVGFERNYVKNLCNSVIDMMKKHETVIVFPEGGRSYTGKMLEIKNGLLGAAVLLQARVPEETVVLLPMSISYENPPDVPYFGLLLKGKKYRKRGNPLLKRLWGSILYFGADLLAFGKFLSAPKKGINYGAVYVDYAQPVTVKQLVTIEENKLEGSKDEFFAHRTSMQIISDAMRVQFLTLYRLLPMHVVAAALTDTTPIAPAAILLRVGSIIDACKAKKRNCTSIDQLTHHDLITKGIEQLRRLKAVHLSSGLVAIKNRMIVDYMASAINDGISADTVG